MQLTHLSLSQLSVSAANMRNGKKNPDITDLAPSIKARGVLVPLLVRAVAEADRFEIVAGRRRYFAAMAIAEGGYEAPLLPCAIMEGGDDAAALEASIIENYARQDPDEVTQWVSLTHLIKEGRSVAQIAATFGMENVQVKRILALGNLLPRIRDLYAKGEIDALTVRHLTMASRARQAEWLRLLRDPEGNAPTGHRLKNWLLGGESIATGIAIFDLSLYPDPIITDLFGEERYFSDAESFWHLQFEAIDALRQSYLDAGWADVIVSEPGHTFQYWEHDRTTKAKGGKVYIAVTYGGEVTKHEGYLTTREARKRERLDEDASPPQRAPIRPELSAPLRDYLDLHRHAMVQASLIQNHDIVLRLVVAHIIAGSLLWSVKPDPLRTDKAESRLSHAQCPARAAFAEARSAAQTLLGFGEAADTLVSGGYGNIDALVDRLVALTDAEVMSVLSVAMAETLAVGSSIVNTTGTALGIDPLTYWQADEAFLSLLKQRPIARQSG